jgi:GT2 family glycosyltransferase
LLRSVRLSSHSYDVTAVVVNFNGGELLLETIRSLRAQEQIRLRVLLFDDGSMDGSAEVARQSGLADGVHVSQVNTKYANRWRAAGMEAATTDLVLVTDNDVEFDSQCLVTLARTFEEDRLIAAVTPAIYDSNDQERPYSLGGLIHCLGLSVRFTHDDVRIIDSVGAGITMYSKSRLKGLGSYDTALLIGWGDDGEFHQRIRLAGLRSVVNRRAKTFHSFAPFSADRAYRVRGAAHNRLRFIATHYSVSTLIGLLPLLIAFEVFQVAFYSVSGLGRAYLSGVAKFLRELRGSFHRRGFVQAIRKRPDRELLCSGEVFIPAHVQMGEGLVRHVLRVANTLIAQYWRVLVWATRGFGRRY